MAPFLRLRENVGKYGLENVLFPVGSNFIEIVSPTRTVITSACSCTRKTPAPRFSNSTALSAAGKNTA
ncbi:MAG: hypothetical protein AABM33_16765 [Pseudomonadota bacterium]